MQALLLLFWKRFNYDEINHKASWHNFALKMVKQITLAASRLHKVSNFICCILTEKASPVNKTGSLCKIWSELMHSETLASSLLFSC